MLCSPAHACPDYAYHCRNLLKVLFVVCLFISCDLSQNTLRSVFHRGRDAADSPQLCPDKIPVISALPASSFASLPPFLAGSCTKHSFPLLFVIFEDRATLFSVYTEGLCSNPAVWAFDRRPSLSRVLALLRAVLGTSTALLTVSRWRLHLRLFCCLSRMKEILLFSLQGQGSDAVRMCSEVTLRVCFVSSLLLDVSLAGVKPAALRCDYSLFAMKDSLYFAVGGA